MTNQLVSHYRLVKKLGAGAFGEVWEGEHQEINSIRVAIKLLHPALSSDPNFIDNLKKECALLHTLQHPNIVAFRDLVLSGERPAMVMELVEGTDAYEQVQKGALSAERVLSIGRDALSALAFAHSKGVIHRDIKPSNLFLCEDGTTKLLDFGIAKAADGSNATKTGTIQGTVQYIAPELFQGKKASESSDLYALGLSLWELLKGRPACPDGPMFAQMGWHTGQGLTEKDMAGLPTALAKTLLRLCAKSEGERFGSTAAAQAAWGELSMFALPEPKSASPRPPSTVTLDLGQSAKPSANTSPSSLPPQSVVLEPAAVNAPLEREPSSAHLPPQSVVLKSSEAKKAAVSPPPPTSVDDVSAEPSKSSGGGKGLVFGGLGVLALVGGYFVFGSSYSTVEVSGGSFMMGCLPIDGDCDSDEEPRHQVVISHDMIVMRTEVTQGLYESVMGSNPSDFLSCGSDCPVENVSWYDAVVFANALSRKEGLSECYEINGEDVRFDVNCIGWRLPTEAEWEYLARGDGEHKYSGSNSIGDVAWYSDNSGSETHPVGQKQANGFGLYDMSGNVYEWTWDWYGDYSSGSVPDPRGPSSGSNRVYRGGSWLDDARNARASGRDFSDPSGRYGLGFRLLRKKI